MDHRLQLTASREERLHQAQIKLRMGHRPSTSRGDIMAPDLRCAVFSRCSQRHRLLSVRGTSIGSANRRATA